MQEKQKATRRQCTIEERAAAVALAARKGVNAAARELGIPQTNVSKWQASATPNPSTERKVEASSATTPPVAPAALPAPAAAASPAPEARPRSTVAKVWTPSQKAEILEHAAAHGVTVTSEKFGVSRFSIYEWQRRVKLAAAGKGPSPTSGPAPLDIEAQRDKEILDEWHRQPGLGPSQIVNQLRRKGIKVSPTP